MHGSKGQEQYGYVFKSELRSETLQALVWDRTSIGWRRRRTLALTDIEMKSLLRRRIDTDALRSRDATEVCVAFRRGVLEIASKHRRLVGGVRILLSFGITRHRHHIGWKVPENRKG